MSRLAGQGSSRPPRPPGTPARARERTPIVDREGGAIALRLAIGKDGLGIELARPATVACIDIIEIVVRLPQVRFPFDVSGGVGKFRHKRGELGRLGIEIDGRRAARWAEPRLRGIIGAAPCTVTIEPRAFGATVTIATREDGALRALAFDAALVPAPAQDDLAVVVHAARGANLPKPATALALHAMTALLGAHARREGSRFVMTRAAEHLARRIMPEAGARAPSGTNVRLSGSGASDGVLGVFFADAPPPVLVPELAALANEAAQLTRAADDALFVDDLARARDLALTALERAPRHPELARRIAEIDASFGGRAEAAVATLREAATAPRTGLLLGMLLVEAGDRAGAVAALLREAEREPSGAVAAATYAEAARLATDEADALAWLDLAIARAPRTAELRWDRARRRIAAGRLGDARADFQELEALASGVRERHDVLRRAAEIHRAAGLGAEAAALYEKALLYRPEDPEALAGLGAALASEGRAARGAALLAHAIERCATKNEPRAWMDLELAKILADRLGDRPAAVARLRAIPDDTHEAIAARGLEGRYRAELGDSAGASLAYARMRERAGNELTALFWLLAAARFEEDRGDLPAAQRHLATAHAIAPSDIDIEARYRTLGERIAERAGVTVPVVRVPEPPPPPPPTPSEPFLDEAEAEARVETLTRTLQGDPTNDAVIDELVRLLTRLNRGMELLALLSARLEDAPADRRAELLPKHREVLEHLERDARAAGRDGEADLFKMARDAS